ncbi:hypothetical protein [uncultured Sphingomonas sp.]|uniref:hypothetical protein n=1 Tax=uncultured Sphingomonas sp. TaxID=158754 RepID=UPI0025CCD8DE|nr:hypothetical protein [uncultured Sphingomonas sp.]
MSAARQDPDHSELASLRTNVQAVLGLGDQPARPPVARRLVSDDRGVVMTVAGAAAGVLTLAGILAIGVGSSVRTAPSGSPSQKAAPSRPVRAIEASSIGSMAAEPSRGPMFREPASGMVVPAGMPEIVAAEPRAALSPPENVTSPTTTSPVQAPKPRTRHWGKGRAGKSVDYAVLAVVTPVIAPAEAIDRPTLPHPVQTEPAVRQVMAEAQPEAVRTTKHRRDAVDLLRSLRRQ